MIFLLLILEFVKYVPSITYPRFVSKTRPEWTFVRNNRGTPQLYYFGHIFRCDGNVKNITKKYFTWRCVVARKSECKGRLAFKGNRLVKESPHSGHPKFHIDAETDVEYKSLEDDDIFDWLKGH